MAYCLRGFCHAFRKAGPRKVDLSRTLFGVHKTFLKPRAPERLDLDKFKIFYAFPRVRFVCLMCSARYLKVGSSIAFGSLGYVLYIKDVISKDHLIAIIFTGLYFTLAVLWTCYLGRNLIGRMYANSSRTQIVISSVNSKGQRVNRTYKRDDLVMLDHPNVIGRKFFKRIVCQKENMEYNLYYSRGMKIDFFVFMKIFPEFE